MPARKADSPFLADWFVILLRWLVLLVAALVTLFWGPVSLPLALTIGAGALWNAVVSIFAILNRRLTGHRVVNVFLDLVLCAGLFLLSGGILGPLRWIGFLVLFSAAIFYEWRGSLTVALLLVLLEAVYFFLSGFKTFDRQAFGLLAGLTLLTGLVLGVIGIKLMELLRASYFSLVRKRKEADIHIQLLERNRHKAMYRMIEEISATLNYQSVLGTALDLGATALSGSEGRIDDLVSAVLLFKDEDQLAVEASRRFPPPDRRILFPAKDGALSKVIQSGEPLVIQNPFRDPELVKLVVLQGCKSAILLPLRRGLDAYGVMLFAHPQAGFFDSDRAGMVEVISHQAVIAIQNALLFRDVEAEKERIIETQEEARRQLARELHDGPTQAISAVAMRINVVRQMIRMHPREAAAELEKIEDLARRTSREIRHMLFTLRPLALESQGLEAALRVMAEKMRETYHQKVIVEVDPRAVEMLKPEKQTVLFSLAEEAVTNARKHARASQIIVRLKMVARDNSLAALEVLDNGVGFDVEAVNRSYDGRGSLGMVNMRERAELINGLLKVSSIPRKGTRVQVVVPLTDEATDRLQRGILPQKE